MSTALLAPASARAHFVLTSPPSAIEQNAVGNPQKAPPCGDDGTAVATNVVTAYGAGDTVTVTIEETVFHPGHYRIALVGDDGVLPEPPPVTPGSTPCGSAPIDPAPVLPVLADGVFVHDTPFDQPQSIDITLPDDISCDNCTLQIIQFMSNHGLNDPGGCYYHHCAAISMDGEPSGTTAPGDDTGPRPGDGGSTDDGGDTASAESTDGGPQATTADPQTSETGAEGTDTTPADADDSSDQGGCACSTAPDEGPTGLAMLLGLGLLGLRTRSRRPSV
ncbi:MAG: SCE4755 family polysaccharide monooxygenase-like protein [Nannocystaceae bacterium]